MYEDHDQAVYDAVLASGQIPEAKLQDVVQIAQNTAQALAESLLQANLLAKAALIEIVAQHQGRETWRGALPEPPPEIVAMVPAALGRTRQVVPLGVEGAVLRVATADPFDESLGDDLGLLIGKPVQVLIADPAEALRVSRRCYGDDSPFATSTETGSSGAEVIDEASLSSADLQQLAEASDVVQFVNSVLAQAVRERASDLHFEPFERSFVLRYRVDGTMRELPAPPRVLALHVISRLKVLANANIAERRLPQDGRIRLNVERRAVDLRLSTLPTQFGESAVLRVLDASAGRLEIEELGLPAAILSGLGNAIARPHGIVIVTGPTGSGKTTTLYSCLKRLNVVGSKLLTVEDPVEYEIDGIMQVAVNTAAGLTFPQALRSFLRQDPDILMVGEIRDTETAQIAIQAALTGHLVLTTLHTNDAASAVTRLLDLGVEPFLLASTLEAVVAQRLLRRICPTCRHSIEIPAEEWDRLGALFEKQHSTSMHKGAGCAQCDETGYKGRIGLFEFLDVTESFREAISRGDSLVKLRGLAAEGGMVTLRQRGIEHLWAGSTTMDEVLKHT